MIVVAYLYNTNGMASWCWEAAHALAEAGESVALVCDLGVEIPETTNVNIIRFAPPQPVSQANKVLSELGRLSSRSSGFAYYLHHHLQSLGLMPSVYLLNQSNLMDVRLDVPQHVVAWAYPTSLLGYLGKIGILSGRKLSRDTIRTAFDAIGWWRKDWHAYRNATSVLAVTKRLESSLSAAGVSASVVHPGTAVPPGKRKHKLSKIHKLLICSVDLEDPRKRTAFLLDALLHVIGPNYCLTLIGKASESFRTRIEATSLPVTFVGQRSRSEVQTAMAEHDIFLFGSCLDDWGYVLIEAMSQGLCVVAPDLSPFDEIIGEGGVLYSPFSRDDLCMKLNALLANDLIPKSETAQFRAEVLFSRKVFSKCLLEATSMWQSQ